MSRAGILVNRKLDVPLHRQLAASIRDAILAGRLRAGERLLSSRELQQHLGLSRNTVVEALEQLHAEGFLQTVRGVGTFVSESFQRSAAPGKTRVRVATSAASKAYLAALPLTDSLGPVAPFRPGVPALDLFPAAQFKRCFHTEDWSADRLDEPHSLGLPALREAIARRLKQTRGVACDPAQILITCGAQAALDVVATVLLRPRDCVLVEDPGFPNARAVFAAREAVAVPGRVDRDGVDPSLFPRKAARLVYVTPSHQYPSGAMLSLERRLALLRWAEKHDAWILEDDYDSEFNYTGRPQPALHGLAGGRRVLYLGTMSKVLSPALRIAFLVVPPELRRPIEAAHRVSGNVQNTIVQAALARFMDAGYFARHIAKMRKVYDERRRFVAASLGSVAGDSFRIRDSLAGLHFIAELPAGISDVAFSAAARKRGVIVPPLSRYYWAMRPENGILVGFAATPPAKARAAVATLAACLPR
ncbi:MAG: PLP-dependent aminotransferase family protein [Candidatus Eremiobacteraeota bacterium]|nr:PLP-dependent aminotransferase family protein [Candidatus Eremiobacteraeota bacterium]